MFGFHEKRKIKKVLFSRPFLVVMCIPVLLMLYWTYNAYGRMQGTIEKRADLSASLSELEGRADNLEKEIKRLDDPRGIETELRSRYEVAGEGEEVIVFVEEEVPTTSVVEEEEEKGILERFFGD